MIKKHKDKQQNTANANKSQNAKISKYKKNTD